MGDSEAGPDVGEDLEDDEEFRSAAEVFKDPNAFEFLSQHGAGGSSQLARESLYVKFDPLIGRPSLVEVNNTNNRQSRVTSKTSNTTSEFTRYTPLIVAAITEGSYIRGYICRAY